MDLAEWHELFVAAAGASAALVGLLIVAMSVNVEMIVKIPSMPSRAAATISALILVVVVSIAGLVPALTDLAFGLITVAAGIAAGVFAVDSAVQILRKQDGGPRSGRWLKSALAVVIVLPFVVGGMLLAFAEGSGLLWIAAGIMLVFVGSVVSAWVLLIEIRR